MQFRKPFKQAIAAGKITLTFRVWKKPQAALGGCYNIPPYGSLRVVELGQLNAAQISNPEAVQAGFADAQALREFLQVKKMDLVWRVKFEYLGQQAVNRPDQTQLAEAELEEILGRLDRWDRKKPWTHHTLSLIDLSPGLRAVELAPQVKLELQDFKRKVRQLKGLGLTESLETGYKLSPRGAQVLRLIQAQSQVFARENKNPQTNA